MARTETSASTRPAPVELVDAVSKDIQAEITPELVRRVAEKVFALLLQDLRLEHERLPQNM